MERREKVSKRMFLFFLCFLFFVLLQFISPLLLPTATITDLSGTTVFLDHPEEEHTIPPPFAIIYSLGDILCHQKEERSLFLNQNQMPFCSRCTAIWIGMAIGICIALFIKFELNMRFIALFFLFIVPLFIDGCGQLIGLWESTNFLRLITGLLAGIISGISLDCIIDELRMVRKEKKFFSY